MSCVCRAANLGFPCRIESSIGGSILVLSCVFGDVNIEVDATSSSGAIVFPALFIYPGFHTLEQTKSSATRHEI